MNRTDRHDEAALRRAMLAATRSLADAGLNRGTSGNLSVRCGDGFLVTPSAMPVEDMSKDSMVAMDFDGIVLDDGKPSSEWRFHRDILALRPDIGAVVHTHSTFASTIACARRDIPPFHYMIAVAGGDSVRCARYALFGSQELSNAALEALSGRKACLLANHGMIALGRDLDEAVSIAVEVEALCEQYWRVLQIGEPVLLTEDEMKAALERFRTYRPVKPAYL